MVSRVYTHYIIIYQLTKQDADLFGSQHLLICPSGLVTVCGTQAQDTEKDLHYAVPLVGINSDVRKIFIIRSLEHAQTITSKASHEYNNYYNTLTILFNTLETVSQRKIDEDNTQPPITGDTTDKG